jgi:dienelactone hydrolase
MFSIKKIHTFILPAFFLFILPACSSSDKNEEGTAPVNQLAEPAKDTALVKSVLIPSIRCKADTSLSYALYLPKQYSAFMKLPVIFLFDSHGSGSFPIEKYKGLAEKYGYILAGSNNSKNGMSWEQNRPQIRTFMKDVAERVYIDSRRIYTCGFSGGSRVASSVAIYEGGINCVIGMGAGFPSLTEPIHNKFDYIGFAGNEDFNMNEMINLSASMDQSPIRHQLIVFNGKHEWAPPSVAEEAFIWMEFNAMKDGLIPGNDTLINTYLAKCKDSISVLEKRNKVYERSLLLKKMDHYFKGLSDVSPYVKENEKKDSVQLQKVIAAKAAFSKEEMTRQEDYWKNFTLKNFQWWTAEVKKIVQQSKNKADSERAIMNKRLLNYLSLAAYMNATSALDSKQYGLAEKYLAIYEMVDPENSEHQYLFARLYAIQKNTGKAEKALRNCFQLGFDDVARIQSDSVLRSFDWQKMATESKEKKK